MSEMPISSNCDANAKHMIACSRDRVAEEFVFMPISISYIGIMIVIIVITIRSMQERAPVTILIIIPITVDLFCVSYALPPPQSRLAILFLLSYFLSLVE